MFFLICNYSPRWFIIFPKISVNYQPPPSTPACCPSLPHPQSYPYCNRCTFNRAYRGVYPSKPPPPPPQQLLGIFTHPFSFIHVHPHEIQNRLNYPIRLVNIRLNFKFDESVHFLFFFYLSSTKLFDVFHFL